jgi:hypothetical protein
MSFLRKQESRRCRPFQLVLDSHLRGNDTKGSRIHGLWTIEILRFAQNDTLTSMQFVTLSEGEGSPLTKRMTLILATKH